MKRTSLGALSLAIVLASLPSDLPAAGAPPPGQPARSASSGRWHGEPVGPPHSGLSGVDCLSSRFCLAVGGAEQGFLAATWDGARWSAQEFGLRGAFANLASVSCVSPSDCMAVGTDGFGEGARAVAARWDGREWTVTPVPKANADSSLLGVSCISPTFCIGVGFSGAGPGSGTLIEQWNGTAWKRQSAPLAYYPPRRRGEGIYSLTSVSCVSESSCVAVGSRTAGVLALRWDGRSWRVQAAPNPHWAYGLNSVACVAGNACMAVGEILGGGHVPGKVLIEHWTGTAWRVLSASSPPNGELTGVSCATKTSCVAVGSARTNGGSRPLIDSWDGVQWRMQKASSGVSVLSGVSCPQVESCTPVGRGQSRAVVEISFVLPGQAGKLRAIDRAARPAA
jgi:hypothetical protein